MKIDVIIPVYRPGRKFLELLRRLSAQTLAPEKIIVMNTEKNTGTDGFLILRKRTGSRSRILFPCSMCRRKNLTMAEPETQGSGRETAGFLSA